MSVGIKPAPPYPETPALGRYLPEHSRMLFGRRLVQASLRRTAVGCGYQLIGVTAADAVVTIAVGSRGKGHGIEVIKRLFGATVVALCFGGTAVSAAAPPTTTPPAVPVPAPAPTQQPTGFGRREDEPLCHRLLHRHDASLRRPVRRIAPWSAYETFGDTCAGRRPAGTLRFCTDVFTDAVVQQTSPTTTSAADYFGADVHDHRPAGAAGSAHRSRPGEPDPRCGWLLGRRDTRRRRALATIR